MYLSDIENDIANLRETAWINNNKIPCSSAMKDCILSMKDIEDAADRLNRFASYFKVAFPETRKSDGILESPIKQIDQMKEILEETSNQAIPGQLYVKLDSNLPISGSIKARGGIYEILYHAEKIALEHGLLHPGDDYAIFDSPEFKELFSKYSIAVGSTGNLGLSIGIISAKLGFHVTIHMSHDARQWKKDMLRAKGAEVIEYEQDYSIAVAQGREIAKKDPYCYFVDDENSQTLFLGYSVAALRLKEQLKDLNIMVDEKHPLFVYLPCGVGGGPGGVAFGLKAVYGDAVHCFFAEPTHSCCMMLGMATGKQDQICVQDLGVDNQTIADGLAVGRASSFVGKLMSPFISGCYSLTDDRMSAMLAMIADTEEIRLEPSALAGMYGPVLISEGNALAEYIKQNHFDENIMSNATHIAWATGGNMVPDEEMKKYYEAGKIALSKWKK